MELKLFFNLSCHDILTVIKSFKNILSMKHKIFRIFKNFIENKKYRFLIFYSQLIVLKLIDMYIYQNSSLGYFMKLSAENSNLLQIGNENSNANLFFKTLTTVPDLFENHLNTKTPTINDSPNSSDLCIKESSDKISEYCFDKGKKLLKFVKFPFAGFLIKTHFLSFYIIAIHFLLLCFKERNEFIKKIFKHFTSITLTVNIFELIVYFCRNFTNITMLLTYVNSYEKFKTYGYIFIFLILCLGVFIFELWYDRGLGNESLFHFCAFLYLAIIYAVNAKQPFWFSSTFGRFFGFYIHFVLTAIYFINLCLVHYKIVMKLDF